MTLQQVPSVRAIDGPTLEIVPLDASDLDSWTAQMHVLELPHGLFPQLGVPFVHRWHRAHLASPHGVGFLALLDGRPVGYALGSTDRAANVAWLLANRRWHLIPAATWQLLRRPRLLATFVATRGPRYLRRLVSGAATAGSGWNDQVIGAQADVVAVLEAIVVIPLMRGRGIGSSLVTAFLKAAAVAGADRAELVTMAGDHGASGFYERQAWSHVGTHNDRDGETVLTYRIEPRRLRPV